MKTVKIQGGIGNQLFCLAFARSVARLAMAPVALDLAAFGADRYGHAFDLADLARGIGDIRFVQRPVTGGRLATALMRSARLPGYVSEGEPPPNQAALAALIARGIYFNGYWQHEAYITDPEGLVAQAREAVLRRAGPAEIADVVIHYRTYREEIRARARRVPGPAYFEAALAKVESVLGHPAQVCLVSDEPAAALRGVGDIAPKITVVARSGPWDDLAMLMQARALILTNSSFSWWGGFCGDASVVVYPRRDGFFHYPAPARRFVCI